LVPVMSESLGIPLPAFGAVLSAALFGLMIAAMGSGPIADRYGRRWVVIVSVVIFAFFALMTARANTIRELILLRFLTGLGLGGRGAGTLLLWIPFFMNLLILYFILGWLPALLRQSGMPVSAGYTAIAYFSTGGIIGTLTQGHVTMFLGTRTALLVDFVACIFGIASLALNASTMPIMLGATLLLGITVQG